MNRASSILVLQLAAMPVVFPVAAQVAAPTEPRTALMPRVEDYTSMWWQDGFPGVLPQAAWRRVIQTGYYALVVDTETLGIPHFGPIPPGIDYGRAGRGEVPAWAGLPPAALDLILTVNGRTYRCTGGGRWGQYAGPRLIESGRFVQRADITDLSFASSDGDRLNVEARFETVAWPDRLALILAARPGLVPNQTSRREEWESVTMEIRLRTDRGELKRRAVWSPKGSRSAPSWSDVSLALEPESFTVASSPHPVVVRADEWSGSKALRVDYDAARGWFRLDLDGIKPLAPVGEPSWGNASRDNDALERVKLTLVNPGEQEQVARLLFAKGAGGIRHNIGSPITGVSAILRDRDGFPTGIPVQLSKNWHTRPQGGVYAGTWVHGFSQVRMPAGARVELELTIAYGHWGGVPAASHAQLCLIGWGTNQRWDESALGSWGESICYEPDQIQGRCSILDVRPAMVWSMNGRKRWSWTHNVGGGDFFRFFTPGGERIPHAAMRAAYQRHGPCLTEVTYAGRLGEGIRHAETVSLARTDDLVRGTYRIRMDVAEPAEFGRLVFFQIGADTYSYTREGKMVLGDETGVVKAWATQWGGNAYRMEPIECAGRLPWISLHDGSPRGKKKGEDAWANRGIVIRSWTARLGGRPAHPWVAERGLSLHGTGSSTLDVVSPPGLTRLEPGDFVEATIEHIVLPQFATDYYGPNQALRETLSKHENTWRMVFREALENDRRVEVSRGTLEQLYPDVRVHASGDKAAFTLTGGLGYVPVTLTGLTSNRGAALRVDGDPVDQSVHGRDFWQTDFDAASGLWSHTYNVAISDGNPHTIHFSVAEVPLDPGSEGKGK